MAAMMVLMMVLMLTGPHHGWMGGHDASRADAQAPYTYIQAFPAGDAD
jgi:hypothetical protein